MRTYKRVTFLSNKNLLISLQRWHKISSPLVLLELLALTASPWTCDMHVHRHMGRDSRKLVFRTTDQVWLKPASSATENINWELWNFVWSKFDYHSFQIAKIKGAYQTARMRKLICASVVRMQQSRVFSRLGQYENWNMGYMMLFIILMFLF